jgi:hypothetical protein
MIGCWVKNIGIRQGLGDQAGVRHRGTLGAKNPNAQHQHRYDESR